MLLINHLWNRLTDLFVFCFCFFSSKCQGNDNVDLSLCFTIIQLLDFHWLDMEQCQAKQHHQHHQQQPLADEWLLRWRRGSKGLICTLLSHPCFYPLSNRCQGEMDSVCRRSGLMAVVRRVWLHSGTSWVVRSSGQNRGSRGSIDSRRGEGASAPR